MAEYSNKMFRRKVEIDGVCDKSEEQIAGDILFKIYDEATKLLNNGGMNEFNSKWKEEHPDWVYTGSVEDEYFKAYEKYFKSVVDNVADELKSPYKFKEHNPCLINDKDGYFVFRGYKELCE